jgi:hypothetical protein
VEYDDHDEFDDDHAARLRFGFDAEEQLDIDVQLDALKLLEPHAKVCAS